MKRHAPATARNSEPIAEVLAQELPKRGLVLEIASGSGEHAVFMTRRLPDLVWQPSDPDTDAVSSIEGWAEEAGLENLKPPLELDARSPNWPISNANAIVCINMVHISPWQASTGLFSGAARLLDQGAPLILYAPYFEDGVDTAPSNLAFDESLKARNPEWGIRHISALDQLAGQSGLTRTARHVMPANNLTLVYRRA